VAARLLGSPVRADYPPRGGAWLSLSGKHDEGQYEKSYAFCDVLVIGAGPAGIDGRADGGHAQVRRCDPVLRKRRIFGGRLLGDMPQLDGAPAADWRGKGDFDRNGRPAQCAA
jgi:hypothetical protein